MPGGRAVHGWGVLMTTANTSESHPIRVDFVDGKLTHPGRLGMTIAPGKKQHGALSGHRDRDLDKDLGRLHTFWKADVLVTLLEAQEFADLKITELQFSIRWKASSI